MVLNCQRPATRRTRTHCTSILMPCSICTNICVSTTLRSPVKRINKPRTDYWCCCCVATYISSTRPRGIYQSVCSSVKSNLHIPCVLRLLDSCRKYHYRIPICLSDSYGSCFLSVYFSELLVCICVKRNPLLRRNEVWLLRCYVETSSTGPASRSAG